MAKEKLPAGAVPCELARIMICETSDAQYIVLREKEGTRAFPILIGTYEALAINRGVAGQATPRPLTHELLLNVIEGLGGALQRIFVNDLKDDTFYARLFIERDGETCDIDARPSDSIALAVLRGVPIFVAEKVLAKVGQAAPPPAAADQPEGGAEQKEGEENNEEEEGPEEDEKD